MAERRYYPVPEGLAGQRVDAVLARMTGMSRAACAKVVETGGVWIDGRLASKSDRAQQDSVVEILVPEPAVVEPRPSPAGLPRLFEDGDIVVVDKPQGMAAHPSLNFDGPDVLAGMMGAFLAQGLDPFDAAMLACALHAEAGKLAECALTSISVIPEDVIEHIPAAIKRLVAAAK